MDAAVMAKPGLHADQPALITRLTRGLAQGDEAAFSEFHSLYFVRLYRFLLVVSRGNEDQAEEALQQTLLRVARYAREFESEEVFWGWLKAVARTAALDLGRHRSRYTALLERFALAKASQAPDPLFDEEHVLDAALSEILRSLEQSDRRLIEGKYLQGETVRELAAATGLTEKAVEGRLSRLRQQLRAGLIEKLRTL